MNNKQKHIFRKLAEIFSKHDLDDIRVALDAFRDEELLSQFAYSASITSQASRRIPQDVTKKKTQRAAERLAEIDREVFEDGTEEQRYALRVAKRLLDRQAFSGTPLIREMLQNLDVIVAKSISDRSQLVISLYSHLANESVQRIHEVEKIIGGYEAQSSTLADWSKVINRKDENE